MNNTNVLLQFEALLRYFPQEISQPLKNLSDEIKLSAEEVRLRAGRPLAVTINGTQFFVKRNSTSLLPGHDCVTVTEKMAQQCFYLLCNHSVYSHKDEICNGFLIIEGGHRAGICGTVASENGKIVSIKDISSINIRIAKEVPHCADKLIKAYNGGGVLICGAPGSGKTTLIRDMVRQLAGGTAGKFLKVAVIDSRGEIAAVSHGVPTTDLGSTADVITACPKGKGIEMALRTLYPDIIAFDELGDMEEVNMIKQGLNSGVSIITTAHAGSIDDIYKRCQTKSLIDMGAIDNIAICSNKQGFSYEIIHPDAARAPVVSA